MIEHGNTESIYSSKILIVDDAEFSRCLVSEIFKNAGFYNIECATDGREGIEKTESYAPDLVLLDLMMPIIDGFEYCQTIRKNERFKQLPVLVQSAAGTTKHVAQAFASGATDFVGKPVNADEIIARAKVHLENQLLVRDLNVYRKQIESGMQSARSMQDSLMPNSDHIAEIGEKYKFHLSAHFRPSIEIGGDFWGLREISENELAIYNVDLSGHGVGAAINTFRLHMLLQEEHNFFSDPALCLAKLNNRMCDLLATGQFATMFYAVVNFKDNTMRYASAGAPHPIVCRENGDIENVLCYGVPLGAVKNVQYDEHVLDFYSNDAILLYSDALIESPNSKNEFLEEDAVGNILKASNGKTSQERLDNLLEIFDNFTHEDPDDDLTLCMYVRD